LLIFFLICFLLSLI